MTQVTTPQIRIDTRLPGSLPLSLPGSNGQTSMVSNVTEVVSPMIENMARMHHTQNQAMQASNMATVQTLQAVERTQEAFHALVEENTGLQARVVALENLVRNSNQIHELQIQALTRQYVALQQHVMSVDQKRVELENDYKTHHHVLERGSKTVQRHSNTLGELKPVTLQNVPIKVTPPPSHQKIPEDSQGCLIQ